MFLTITVWRISIQQTGSEQGRKRFPIGRVTLEIESIPTREILVPKPLLLWLCSVSSFQGNESNRRTKVSLSLLRGCPRALGLAVVQGVSGSLGRASLAIIAPCEQAWPLRSLKQWQDPLPCKAVTFQTGS